MEDEIKLLGMWASPYSRRIELALKLKGLQFDYVEENLFNKSDLLLDSNPVHKKIPVLFHNGKQISESLVIIEYIDETWGTTYSILPEHPYDRAVARFRAKFVDEKVLATSIKAYTGQGKEQEDGAEEFTQQIKYLEGELIKNGKEYFGGEKIGFVDVAAFFMLYGLGLLEEVTGAELMTKEKFPVMFKWMEKLRDDDVVKGCLPPRDKHLEYVRSAYAFLMEAAASKTKGS